MVAAPLVVAAPDAQALVAAGNLALDAGRLNDAAGQYEAALALQPDFLPALVNLAFVRLQVGPADAARLHLEQVLQIDPDHADALFMLGQSSLSLGDAAAAIKPLTRLLELQPAFVMAYPVLCRALALEQDSAQAMNWVVRGLAIDPGVSDLHQIKGNLELERRDYAAAVASYSRALALAPATAETHGNLGLALAAQGQFQAAQESLREALRLQPATAQGCEHLGTTLQSMGLLQDAVTAFQRALKLEPNRPSAHRHLGLALQHQGLLPQAQVCLQRAVELQPLSAAALHDLGTVQYALGNTPMAVDCMRRAQLLEPQFAPAYSALATILVEQGDHDQAIPLFGKALELDPELVEARSQQLFVLSFNSDRSNYLRAARAYGDCVTRLATPFSHWPAAKTGRQTLRVGLVSGDLRAHPVGYFLESVLQHLKACHVEVVGFPTQAEHDATTLRLKSHCVDWRPLFGMTDAMAAKLIHAAQVQVLVDLSGHTAHNRLPVFAWQPAPVQVSWLGYFASTGVPAIEYLLADAVSVPPGTLEDFSESICYLPKTRLCFTAPGPDMAVNVAPLPAQQRGFVTLGCYQNLNKLNPRVLGLWQRVLTALPTAKLRLQNRQTASPQQRQQLLDRLVAAGMDRERIVLAPPTRRSEYLSSYAEVDFMLDTFPYTGGTTTCEALWMGVPTLTLAGQSMLSRQGQALLGAAGLPGWVAEDEDHFVQLATAKAQDLDALALLRSSLRERVQTSALFDAPSFARDWAQALRTLWTRHEDGH